MNRTTDSHLPTRPSRREPIPTIDGPAQLVTPTSALVRTGEHGGRPPLTVGRLQLDETASVPEALFGVARAATAMIPDAHPWVGRPALDCLRSIEWACRNGRISAWHWDRHVTVASKVVTAVWRQMDGGRQGDANTERVVRIIGQLTSAGRLSIDGKPDLAGTNLRAAVNNMA